MRTTCAPSRPLGVRRWRVTLPKVSRIWGISIFVSARRTGSPCCARSARAPTPPVIIATGQRSDEIDRIVGLELGADYYIVKPFSLRELFARIRAVLRRQEIGRAVRACDPERGG